MTPPPPARPALAALVVTAAVEAGLVLLTDPGSYVATWWSSVGIAIATLALAPTRWWLGLLPTLVTVVGAVHLVDGASARDALADGLVYALMTFVGALLVTHGLRRRGQLETITDLMCVLSAAAAIGVIAVVRLTLDQGSALLGADLLAELTEQAVPTLLLLALVLSLGSMTRPRSGSAVEVLAQVAALALVTAATVGPTQDVPLLFLPIPFLVWGALRFDLRVVALELVAFAFGVTVATANDWGPVPQSDLGEAHLPTVVLAYVLSCALIALPLALIVGQRMRLLARVSADEHIFRRNFTESPLGMLLLHEQDGDLVVDDLNKAACGILGQPSEEVVGRQFAELVGTLDPMEKMLSGVQSGSEDTWHGHASALSRPGSRLEVAVAALDWRDGSRVYSAQLLDVTQEHDAHRRLQAAHKLTDTTLDTTACVIMVTDSKGTIVRVNAATKEITGYSDADLVGQRLWDTTLGSLTREETEAMFVWPNRSGYPIVRERLSRSATGDPLRIVWNNNVVRDEFGLPSYAVLTGIDVTVERSTTGLMSHLLSASIATALIGIDTGGRVTLFNTGASHLLGYTGEEMLGRPFVELFDPQQLLARTGAVGERDAFLCLLGTIGDAAESKPRDWTWRTRTGHRLIVSMTLSVTDDQVEDRVGFLCVGRDVTEQRQGQETLVAALEKERTALDRLRSLDRAKDEFVSTVSHELRTPVTSIIGFTEMLLDGSVVDPHPDQQHMLDTIARNGQKLVAICNDLLLLSGFDTDAPPLVQVPVDLRDCLRHAADWSVAAGADSDLEVRIEAPADPVVVSGDPDQLDRVLTNLISNALKFTPAGGTVTASLREVGASAVVTVTDTGIGIAAEEHEAVFQRFYRTETAQTQAIPGTGLGLPIVAAIVHAHHGRIELDSAPGQGTTFRVVLPCL